MKRTYILSGAALAIAVTSATAQEAGYLAEFERPYGWAYGSEDRPFDADTRDSTGNRVIINGLIQGGSSLATGLHTGWGQTDGVNGQLGSGSSSGFGSAVGNQLNVVTNGSNNTIIIDNTQINNGNQNVTLNGELNLND
jgi:holdfast attachment protein HfaA